MSKFKVGDRVKIINDRNYRGEILDNGEYIGKVGYITRVSNMISDNVVYITYDIKAIDEHRFFLERDLELYKEPKKEITQLSVDTCVNPFYHGFMCEQALKNLTNDMTLQELRDVLNNTLNDKQTNKINTNNMNLREKIQFALTNEPLKTLIKNDVRNQDGTLTCQGQGMFQDFLEAKFREEFDTKTIADIKALEEEENKTKKK